MGPDQQQDIVYEAYKLVWESYNHTAVSVGFKTASCLSYKSDEVGQLI